MVDAEVEGSVLLCGDCAELERPGVGGRSSRVSVGESARSNRFIFLSTFVKVSIVFKFDRDEVLPIGSACQR